MTKVYAAATLVELGSAETLVLGTQGAIGDNPANGVLQFGELVPEE